MKIRATTWSDLSLGLIVAMGENIPLDARVYLDDLNSTIEIVWEDNDAERSSTSDEESAGQEGGEETSGSGDAGRVVDLDEWRNAIRREDIERARDGLPGTFDRGD